MNVVENTNNLYVTKQEFCKLCGISESTAYKLIKSKKVNFEKKRDGLLHYYAIPIEEAEQYIRERANRGKLTKEQISSIKTYNRNKMRDYPQVIDAKDIRTVTVYGKEIIRKWITSLKFRIEKCGGTMQVKHSPQFELTVSIPLKSEEKL